MAKVRNIKDLTESLADQYNKLLKGAISVDQADAVSRMAATMIGACKIQIQYNSMMDNKEPIAFMERLTLALPSSEPHTPVKGLSEHVVELLEQHTLPMYETDVRALLLSENRVPTDYFENHPEAMLRGALLGLSRGGRIRLTKDPEGRAMFAPAGAEA